MGDVYVALNSDAWLVRKKGYAFMSWEERCEILMAMHNVAIVLSVDDKDDSVCNAIRRIKPDYFANGGDRAVADPLEAATCLELGVQQLFGLGGEKIQSSSDLVRKRVRLAVRDSHKNSVPG